ncbi:MAG TPA: phosphate ABC transporter substrate-binding protein PstS [Mycobacteriales bacterium]|nr:phosphate ABC transporter substrate-binding protein PstS [Mycobacteriales bacterium]
MKVSLVTRTAGLAAVAAIGLTACGSSSSGGTGSTPSAGGSGGGGGASSTSLSPQGSTFQATLEEQWATKFHTANPSDQITYSPTGSTAGIAAFTQGTAPFAGSDVTMSSDEQSAADNACGSPALTIPITSGGVAIMYDLPGVSKPLNLSAATIAGIFMGKITSWNDAAIKADNPGVSLPNTPVSVYYRADGSGTTNVLSGFLDAAAHSVWTLGVNKQFTNWPTGSGATGSSGVAQGVKSTPGGITYAEITYAKQDGLQTANVKGFNNSYLPLTNASVAQSIASGFAVTGTGQDLAGSLSFDKMTGYPISTVSYVLVCSTYKNAGVGALVKSYLTYAAGDGQSEGPALGFAPLPKGLDRKVMASVASIS